MAETVDFSTLRLVLPFVFGSVSALWNVLSNPEEATKELNDLVGQGPFAQAAYLRRQRARLCRKLLGPIYLLAHALNLAVLGALVATLLIGPEILLKDFSVGSLAEPLSLLELAIYGIVLVASGLYYVRKAAIPMLAGWFAALKVTFHLRKLEP